MVSVLAGSWAIPALAQRYDSAGNQIVTVTDGTGALNVICDSGCAGGAQYTEGDIDATITGTARTSMIQNRRRNMPT